MQLFLDSYGAYLGVKDGMFSLRLRQATHHLIAVRDVKAILLSPGVSVSTNALALAIAEGIPVILTDRLEHPIGQVWSGQFGSIATIRKNQAFWTRDPQAMEWVQRVMLRKLRQQVGVLEEQAELRNRELGEVIANLERAHDRFARWRYEGQPLEQVAATFRGWEGGASRQYFRGLAQLVPANFQFSGRSRRPAFDAFNALLNYLYGFLYAQVELSLMKAGLDPYSGVLHTDEYRRPALVFDVIECYRSWAETVALQLCWGGLLQPASHFLLPDPRSGYRLERSGKRIVVPAMLTYLAAKESKPSGTRARRVRIDLDAQALAQTLLAFEPGTNNPFK